MAAKPKRGAKPRLSTAIRRGAGLTRPVTGLDLGREAGDGSIIPVRRVDGAKYANVIGAAMVGSGCRTRRELLGRFPALEQHIILPGLRYRNERRLIEVLERVDAKRQLSREGAADILREVGL